MYVREYVGQWIDIKGEKDISFHSVKMEVQKKGEECRQDHT